MSIAPSPQKLPPLQQGDRLTRAEFERRYEAMPNVRKAELIEGEVHMPSPVRMANHSSPHGRLVTWMGTYEAYTPGVRLGVEVSLRLDRKNEPQPDGLLMIEAACGGQAMLSGDDYVENGPELIGEIAASSVSIDLGKKKQAYRRNNVREYIVWRVEDEAIDWFIERQGNYEPLAPTAAGILTSEILPGLWLDPAALLRGGMIRVLAVVQEGVASQEHAAFVERLKNVRGTAERS